MATDNENALDDFEEQSAKINPIVEQINGLYTDWLKTINKLKFLRKVEYPFTKFNESDRICFNKSSKGWMLYYVKNDSFIPILNCTLEVRVAIAKELQGVLDRLIEEREVFINKATDAIKDLKAALDEIDDLVAEDSSQ